MGWNYWIGTIRLELLESTVKTRYYVSRGITEVVDCLGQQFICRTERSTVAFEPSQQLYINDVNNIIVLLIIFLITAVTIGFLIVR